MANDGFDLGAIGDILSSMSSDDIENLKGAAQSLFSSAPEKPKKPPESVNTSQGMPDFSSLAKIASIMSLLSSEQNDPRCNLLAALRPMLTEPRQQKIDQAVKMLHLLAVLPKLKEIKL